MIQPIKAAGIVSLLIMTQYGLVGMEIGSLWRRDFPCLPERPRGFLILLYKDYRVFPGCKAAGAWC